MNCPSRRDACIRPTTHGTLYVPDVRGNTGPRWALSDKSSPRILTMQLSPAATLLVGLLTSPALAQSVTFNFNNAPPSTPLPITVNAGGIGANLSGTMQGFSVQQSNVMGFTPVGFSGLCIYPSSVFPADLNVSFTKTLTSFSILCAVQDLYCDDGATMKVTAKMNGTIVGTATATAPPDFYWPTTTLSITVPGGFNSVTVHYQSPPPGCGDWGPIFMADNMVVTPAPNPVGDINGDSHVNAADLGLLLGAWGTASVPSDLDHNGLVEAADLSILLGGWTG